VASASGATCFSRCFIRIIFIHVVSARNGNLEVPVYFLKAKQGQGHRQKNGENILINRKVKQSHCTPWRWLGERKYSSYSFLTSDSKWGLWSESRPRCAFAPGKGAPKPIVQEAGWASEPVWTQTRGKILCLCHGCNPNRRSSSP
jgi:hypothetical protein